MAFVIYHHRLLQFLQTVGVVNTGLGAVGGNAI